MIRCPGCNKPIHKGRGEHPTGTIVVRMFTCLGFKCKQAIQTVTIVGVLPEKRVNDVDKYLTEQGYDGIRDRDGDYLLGPRLVGAMSEEEINGTKRSA